MNEFRVLVCGGRDFINKDVIWMALDRIARANDSDAGRVSIVHGAARGVDTLAGWWAIRSKRVCHIYPANWDRYGKSAGMIRNKEMLDNAKPDLVVCFPGGRGTAMMRKLAEEARVPTIVVDERGVEETS